MWNKASLWFCAGLTGWAFAVPAARSLRSLEVNYNEGWNVYTADLFARGGQLYPAANGWTSVNYPMLSFALMAGLHRITHDYLITARLLSILSLLVASALVGAVSRSLGAGRRAASLGALFCFAIFCTSASNYVGADDPQLLAQAVFMAGLLLYVRHRRSPMYLGLAALVFVVAGMIKHNPVDIPAAVFLDVAFSSVALASWFLLCCAVCAGVGVLCTLHFGGPFFLAQLFTPRHAIPAQVPEHFLAAFGPVLLPLCLACAAAWRQMRQHPERRIAVLLFGTTVLTGTYFSSGSGVSINAYFSGLLALSVLLGLYLEEPTPPFALLSRPGWAAVAPAFCFVWLLIPLALCGNLDVPARLRDQRDEEGRFARQVAFLRAHPGPALCESLLVCFEAGKPYVYDPFNATRLLGFGRLDARTMVDALHSGRVAVVQMDEPLTLEDSTDTDRWAPSIRNAIRASYRPALRFTEPGAPAAENGVNAVLYMPR